MPGEGSGAALPACRRNTGGARRHAVGRAAWRRLEAPGRGPLLDRHCHCRGARRARRPGAWTYRSRTRDLPDWAGLLKAGQLTQIVSYAVSDVRPDAFVRRTHARLCRRAPAGPDRSLVGRVAGGARVQLTNDEAREESPKFSPDGECIAFTRRDPQANTSAEIRILPALGGDVGRPFPVRRSRRGRRTAQSSATCRRGGGAGPSELTVSSVDGSDAHVILAADSTYPFMRSPAWSPDRQARSTIVRGTGGVAGEIWDVAADGGSAAALDHRTCDRLTRTRPCIPPMDAASSTRRTAAARRTSGSCRLAAAHRFVSPRGRALTNRRASRRMEPSRS